MHALNFVTKNIPYLETRLLLGQEITNYYLDCTITQLMKVLQNEKNITKQSKSLGALWQITRFNKVYRKCEYKIYRNQKVRVQDL
jgi:hypothetical protein